MQIENISDLETIKNVINQEEIDEKYKSIFTLDYFLDKGEITEKEVLNIIQEMGYMDFIKLQEVDWNLIKYFGNYSISCQNISFTFPLKEVEEIFQRLNQDFVWYSIDDYLEIWFDPQFEKVEEEYRYYLDYSAFLRDQALNNYIQIVKVGLTVSIFTDLNP